MILKLWSEITQHFLPDIHVATILIHSFQRHLFRGNRLQVTNQTEESISSSTGGFYLAEKENSICHSAGACGKTNKAIVIVTRKREHWTPGLNEISPYWQPHPKIDSPHSVSHLTTGLSLQNGPKKYQGIKQRIRICGRTSGYTYIYIYIFFFHHFLGFA